MRVTFEVSERRNESLGTEDSIHAPNVVVAENKVRGRSPVEAGSVEGLHVLAPSDTTNITLVVDDDGLPITLEAEDLVRAGVRQPGLVEFVWLRGCDRSLAGGKLGARGKVVIPVGNERAFLLDECLKTIEVLRQHTDTVAPGRGVGIIKRRSVAVFVAEAAINLEGYNRSRVINNDGLLPGILSCNGHTREKSS